MPCFALKARLFHALTCAHFCFLCHIPHPCFTWLVIGSSQKALLSKFAHALLLHSKQGHPSPQISCARLPCPCLTSFLQRGRPQLVLLDHGLYRELTDDFRMEVSWIEFFSVHCLMRGMLIFHVPKACRKHTIMFWFSFLYFPCCSRLRSMPGSGEH